MPQTRDSEQMAAVVRPTTPPPAAQIGDVVEASDLNQQLRDDAKAIRALADTYLIEEGTVLLRSTIPSE